MAVYNSHQTIDIYVHATKLTASSNNAEKSVNPNKKEDSDNNDMGLVMGPFSSKRQLHNAQNVIRFTSNMAFNVIPNAVVNQISNASCDTNYQAIARRQMEIKQDIANPLMSITNATISGGMIMGPIGALTGLVTSAATSMFSLMNKYESRNVDFALNSWKQQQSVNYNKARAGVDLTDGRSRLR